MWNWKMQLLFPNHQCKLHHRNCRRWYSYRMRNSICRFVHLQRISLHRWWLHKHRQSLIFLLLLHPLWHKWNRLRILMNCLRILMCQWWHFHLQCIFLRPDVHYLFRIVKSLWLSFHHWWILNHHGHNRLEQCCGWSWKLKYGYPDR